MDSDRKPEAGLYRVATPEHASFRCVRVREQRLGVPWHFHPEYQLTLVVRGSGQRIVGDSIAPLLPGDLTLLGPNVPHYWDAGAFSTGAGSSNAGRRGRATARVDAVIVQFRAEFLGNAFWGVPETAGIVRLLAAASRGLAFTAATRRRVAADILALPRRDGLQRLLGLIGVLDQLAGRGRSVPICSAGYVPDLEADDRDRVAPVIHHIHERLARPLRRRELAAIAGVSERSFSRFFRRKLGRTLPEFVNALRVGRARRLLVETTLPVARIAAGCGFHNLSNFNNQFRASVGMTPLEFRRARQAAGADG